MKDSKLLPFFLMLFVTLFLICAITAFRMTTLFGKAVPLSGLFLPVVFSLGDIIADVYGYEASRKLIWNTVICQFIFGLVITALLTVDSPMGDNQNIHYQEVFKHIIRTNLTSCLSVTAGMFANAFLMSKLKIKMHGKRFFIRTILSSSISELLLCTIAYSTLYLGLKPFSEIIEIILFVWYYKLIFAVAAAPIISLITPVIRHIEKKDAYDYGVNYNPFIYHEEGPVYYCNQYPGNEPLFKE